MILQTVSAAPLLIESEALGLPENEIMPMIEPTTLQAHPIYNPDLDYSIYLTQPFFFIIFQVLILLVTVYSVGAEMKFGTAEEWLTEANGSIVTAIFGKLLPYTVMFILVSIFANAIFFGVMNIPYTNNFIGINLVSIVFVLATQGFGLFIFALFPAMSIIISIASMVGSLGATLSGVTFPLPSMYLFFYYASYAFPIRYYIESIQTMLYTEGTILYVWPQVSVLIFFLALPITILRHLKTTIFNHKYDDIE